jgi:hypothetical protein
LQGWWKTTRCSDGGEINIIFVEISMCIKSKLSFDTMHIGPAKDAHDVQALGTARLEKLTADFENTMAWIEQESDDDTQEKQLTAYKKLLEEQMDVIDSRLKMVKRIRQE